MSNSLSVTTAKSTTDIEPSGDTMLAAPDFVAGLRAIANESEARSVRTAAIRQVIPAPALCPRPDSPVRFLPLIGTTAPFGQPGSLWTGDGTWTFVDFAAFEGADFAYAVHRCLLHRAPSKRRVAAVEGGSRDARLMLLLSADRKARRMANGGRLVNLDGTRALYLAYRAARKLKLRPLAVLLRKGIAARAGALFERQRDAIVQRRGMLMLLGVMSDRR
jgi:hypothetical protein